MITHYDLFAGIGGFSLALDEVFYEEKTKHIFCEWESFPTAVLKKHWPEAAYYGDIADLVADTNSQRSRTQGDGNNTNFQTGDQRRKEQSQHRTDGQGFSIVTGGFPCQPFSAAGRRRGTADDRYKWPEMFEVIRNVKPTWVIAENVRGLVTWNEGMVLEQVCTDLEAEGYEVQPLIIPAVAVNAPHRRDRVWIIAHTINGGQGREKRQVTTAQDSLSEVDRQENSTTRESERTDNDRQAVRPTPNARPPRRSEGSNESIRPESQKPERPNHQYPDWQRNWQEVAFATCDDSVDDGLPRLVDGVPFSRAKWRKDSLKAYGNAIVPQVAMEIFNAIKKIREEL